MEGVDADVFAPRVLELPPRAEPPRAPRPSCAAEADVPFRSPCFSASAFLDPRGRREVPPLEPGPRRGRPVSWDMGTAAAMGTWGCEARARPRPVPRPRPRPRLIVPSALYCWLVCGSIGNVARKETDRSTWTLSPSGTSGPLYTKNPSLLAAACSCQAISLSSTKGSSRSYSSTFLRRLFLPSLASEGAPLVPVPAPPMVMSPSISLSRSTSRLRSSSALSPADLPLSLRSRAAPAAATRARRSLCAARRGCNAANPYCSSANCAKFTIWFPFCKGT